MSRKRTRLAVIGDYVFAIVIGLGLHFTFFYGPSLLTRGTP